MDKTQGLLNDLQSVRKTHNEILHRLKFAAVLLLFTFIAAMTLTIDPIGLAISTLILVYILILNQRDLKISRKMLDTLEETEQELENEMRDNRKK